MGTNLNFSITYHPETDGQTKSMSEVLEDMLCMYVLDHQVRWEEYLHLVKIAYNNGHHTSLGMPPYRAIYGRPCKTPLSWDKIEDKVFFGPELVRHMR